MWSRVRERRHRVIRNVGKVDTGDSAAINNKELEQDKHYSRHSKEIIRKVHKKYHTY